MERWGRFGHEYMFKQHSGNLHVYHNTIVLLNHAGKGLNLVPEFPTGTYVANNLAVVVNGRVNGSYPTGPGQIVDGNLYWKINSVDANPLLSTYDTVPDFASATGLESHGIGSVLKRGTDPGFATFKLDVVDRTKAVWQLCPTSEVFKPSDFLLSPDSPAIGAGVVLPLHPHLGRLPDTRSSRDIGALPYGVSPAEYDVFPLTGRQVVMASAAGVSRAFALP